MGFLGGLGALGVRVCATHPEIRPILWFWGCAAKTGGFWAIWTLLWSFLGHAVPLEGEISFDTAKASQSQHMTFS